MCVFSYQYICTISFVHCRSTFNVIPLLPKSTFSPSIQLVTSVCQYTSSIYFGHQHPSGRTILIHSLHVFKPSQYSLIHPTRQLPFHSSSSTHLFISNSILACMYANSIHSNSIHSNSIHSNSIHFNSIHYNSIHYNSIHSNTSSQELSLSFSQHFSYTSQHFSYSPSLESCNLAVLLYVSFYINKVK